MTLRRVLHAYREGWLLEERLAAAARMAAADARQHGLAAARMLVAIKTGVGGARRRAAPGAARRAGAAGPARHAQHRRLLRIPRA
jgi:hypothetical protein